MHRLLLIVLFFPLLANAKEKPAKEKSPARVCRILFLNPPADAPKKLFLFDGTASREVELPEATLSEIHKMPAGETVLYLTPNPVEKPDQVPPGAPSAKLPAEFGDFYILVTPDPANTVAPVRIQIMDAGPQKFKKGQMMWFNLTSSTISGQLGSQKLELGGQSRVIVDEPAKVNEPFDVNLSYLIPNDPLPRPVCQTKWIHEPRSRMVMFVHSATENGVPQIAGFKDFRDSPAAK